MSIPYNFRKWLDIRTYWYCVLYESYGVECSEMIEAQNMGEAVKIFKNIYGDKKIKEISKL